MDMNTKYELIVSAVTTRTPFCACFSVFTTRSYACFHHCSAHPLAPDGSAYQTARLEYRNHQRLSPCAVGLGQRIKIILHGKGHALTFFVFSRTSYA